ncbi:hypothetical protein DYB35_007821, partial [Aphanomyces astaci]
AKKGVFARHNQGAGPPTRRVQTGRSVKEHHSVHALWGLSARWRDGWGVEETALRAQGMVEFCAEPMSSARVVARECREVGLE